MWGHALTYHQEEFCTYSVWSVQRGSGKLASWRAPGTDRCQQVPVFLEVRMNILALREPGSCASGDIGLPSGTCEKA